jgi:hypothetical protein
MITWFEDRVLHKGGIYFANSAFTARPNFSSKYGFLMYAPAPIFWASFTRSDSEYPLAMMVRWWG